MTGPTDDNRHASRERSVARTGGLEIGRDVREDGRQDQRLERHVLPDLDQDHPDAPFVVRDPERFDVGRAEGSPLSFGSGIHFCLGAALARMEGQIAFETMLRRLPDLELATERPIYRDHYVIRGLDELRVRFRA